VPINWNFNNYL